MKEWLVHTAGPLLASLDFRAVDVVFQCVVIFVVCTKEFVFWISHISHVKSKRIHFRLKNAMQKKMTISKRNGRHQSNNAC